MKRKLYIAGLFIMISLRPFCQQVPPPPGAELQELVRIAEVYTNVQNLSFNIFITYADSLTWQDIIDSALFDCKLSKGKALLTNDEMELLRGKQNTVYVDKIDSLMVVAPKSLDQEIFQAPLLDSTFRNAHVAGMAITVVDSFLWRFKVTFKPGSRFLTYDMDYDPTDGLIYSINFHVITPAGDHEVPEGHVICQTIYMGGYSEDPIDPVLFNEARFFYRLNGVLYPQPDWAGYTVGNQ